MNGLYPFHEYEPAWQQRWEKAGIFHADRDERRPKWFIIELPPFANGRLHLGHVRNYVIADVSARFRRMAGYNVMYTTGFDSFGLPNENAARECKRDPGELADEYSAVMTKQFVRLGLSHDTRRIIGYHDPEFYRWVQWVFVKLFRAGLAFRQVAKVNWCGGCSTSLADSLVENGNCWRCHVPVEKRLMKQWFVREDGFADSMLEGFKNLEKWPEQVKRIQRDWIGRREGFEFDCPLDQDPTLSITIFLPDRTAIWSVKSISISPTHPVLDQLRESGRRLDLEGIKVRHPLNGREIPVVISDAVESRHGSDVELDAREKPSDGREDNIGRPAVRYRLRDWNIARQRYWGTPIPIVYCEQCGTVPVPEDQLPVVLPKNIPIDAHGNPLDACEEFIHTDCPKCGAGARRDTDTLEAYSSPWWYHWNCRSLPGDDPFIPADTAYWMPVDLMVGGIDQSRTCFFHTRMIARALLEMGYAQHIEPVDELLAIGMVKQSGQKMSKSAGNLVAPDELMESSGADAVRMAILAAAAPENDVNWNYQNVRDAESFLKSLWAFTLEQQPLVAASKIELPASMEIESGSAARRRLASWLSTGAGRITSNLVRNDLHLAVKNLKFLLDRVRQFEGEMSKENDSDQRALAVALTSLLRLATPIVPHIAEELWARLGGKELISTTHWPCSLQQQREGSAQS